MFIEEEIVVSIFQVLDNALLVFFKLHSVGNNLAGTLCFYAQRKTTLPVNRAGNTTQSCSLPPVALLQGHILEQFIHLG